MDKNDNKEQKKSFNKEKKSKETYKIIYHGTAKDKKRKDKRIRLVQSGSQGVQP